MVLELVVWVGHQLLMVMVLGVMGGFVGISIGAKSIVNSFLTMIMNFLRQGFILTNLIGDGE